jgi:hypothetical protein
MEHATVEIDMPAADRWLKGSAADGRVTCAGVTAHQEKACNVFADISLRALVAHNLPRAPRGPQDARRFGSGQPYIAPSRLFRQHHRNYLGAQALRRW